jgi:hypothetical protein
MPVAQQLIFCERVQADVSEDTYNTALNLWLAAEPQPGPPNPINCWNFTIQALNTAIPAPLKPLLSLQLATRHHSPRLAAQNHVASLFIPPEIARAHCCVAVLDGNPIVTTPDISSALLHARARPLDADSLPNASLSMPNAVDHVYKHAELANATSPSRTLVHYGPPGNPCFARVHRAVIKTLKDFEIRDVNYLVRPTLFPGCLPDYSDSNTVNTHSCLRLGSEKPPILSGYGVELALKDTEYVQVALFSFAVGSA